MNASIRKSTHREREATAAYESSQMGRELLRKHAQSIEADLPQSDVLIAKRPIANEVLQTRILFWRVADERVTLAESERRVQSLCTPIRLVDFEFKPELFPLCRAVVDENLRDAGEGASIVMGGSAAELLVHTCTRHIQRVASP